jgi:hypothetical protein
MPSWYTGVDISEGAGVSRSKREDVARVIASSLKSGAPPIRELLGPCGFAGLPGGISGSEISDDLVLQPIKSDK